ncbi:MAG TPA: hypothetical protein VGO71_10285 [Baekduia sp.]|nr:hypothetical protein [Baekduia sp.]
MSHPAVEHRADCVSCGSPLAADQRYCLRCGARHGAPRVDPLEALGFAVEAGTAAGATPGHEAGTVPTGSAQAGTVPTGSSRRGLATGPRLTAALVAATLVLGGVAGAAIGPAPAPSVASAPRRVVAVVVPRAAPAPSATVAAEPPAIDDPPATPTPAAGDTTPATTAARDTTATTTPSSGEPAGATPAPAPAPSTATPATTPTPAGPTAHVWLIALTQLDATTAFGPASPLADLVAKGTLLAGYAPVAASAAANGIALLGGRVPTADCAAELAACVVPAGGDALPDQLRVAGLTWRAYVEDAAPRCAGPTDRVAPSLFTTLSARTDCATNVVGLDALDADLAATPATAPRLSLVVPGICHDGRATPCADGAPAGPAGASPTLHDLVARITASAAYRADGVLVIAPDAPPPPADPAAASALAPTGALVLSSRATPGRTVATPTGPVALLRSLDELLGLDALGGAAQAPAGALDGILAPAVASASAASPFPHRSVPPTTTRRSS